MCGNAGPHMPWHSCRGERTTFGVSGHCPLCFRQGSMCFYHFRCQNRSPVSFQVCRRCSHLVGVLGSTQGCCVLICMNSENWNSGAHVCTQRAIPSVLTFVGDMVSQGWPLNSLSSCLSLSSSGITGVHQHTSMKSRAFCCCFLFCVCFRKKISFCSSFWLRIWYVV